MCRILAIAAAEDLPPAIKSRLLRDFFRSFAETYSGGWGIAYFTDEGPIVFKEPIKATDSFAMPGAIRRTEPGFILAHVRNPTQGDRNVLNTHPFQKDGWLFAHNGTLGDPEGLKARLLERYSETLLGGTDSEILFHYLLQRMEQADDVEGGILRAIRDLSRDPGEGTSSLNFVLTDGHSIFALRKAFMNDEKYPMNFARLDSLATVGGKVALEDHLSSAATVISSEPFTPGEWTSLGMGQLLIADANGHRVVSL
jgi:predicted glutamine amidotransferase